jgi:tetratricopeptide (TPR) repeat protein
VKHYFTSLILAISLLGAGACDARGDNTAYLDTANADLQAGRADEALHKLREVVRQSPQNAAAYNLLCRTYLTEEHWDEAIGACEKAVQIEPNNSDYHMWLGRAYGEKADRVSFVTAYTLSKKVRSEFEAAAQANPRNAAALSDLGEFYAEAPSIVGGGTDKAEDIANRLESIDSAREHELQARIAEAQKDYAKGENEFKAAITASPKPANYWMTLASFYRRRQRWDDMVAAIRKGIAADKEPDTSLPNGAWVLIRANREPQLAAQMLEAYLASPKKTEEAPAFVIHKDLGRLKKQMGDSEGAQREFATAAELASEYKLATENTNSGR